MIPDKYVHPEDLDRHASIKDYVVWKHQLARILRPRGVVEIGVRAGYSMFAFVEADDERGTRYVGIDNECDVQPSKGTWLDWARKLIDERGYKDATLVVEDSQKIDDLSDIPARVRGCDFFHIDGEHTTDGVMHDLDLAEKAWANDGVIVVDDWKLHKGCAPLIMAGVTYWLTRPGRYYETIEVDTPTGDLVIFNQGAMWRYAYLLKQLPDSQRRGMAFFVAGTSDKPEPMTHAEYARYQHSS